MMELLIGTMMVLLGSFSVKCVWWAFDLWFKTLNADGQRGTPKMRTPPPPPFKETYNEMKAINEYWKNTQP